MATIPAVPRAGRAQPAGQLAATRGRIAAAAFELFADQGYEGTTVEAIAERAGVARRTFFRYFRSKEDVIFPDHDALLESVERTLEASAALPAVDAICAGVRQVFASYVTDPEVSVQRYRITRGIAALRDRELASVQRYERAFSRYVRGRLAGTCTEAEAALRADVLAAAVVAAHNAVLREWLRDGGTRDFGAQLEAAFDWVRSTLADAGTPGQLVPGAGAAPTPNPVAPTPVAPTPEPAAADSPAEHENDVVVAVFRAGDPITDIVEKISRSL
ncbi:TetR family transcriptional regulator [Spongisporangium articulatum]|uniref:TetR family transcriptional regulator n=1 Tax=Spongisporangium articulatum TaxID=3362603 RepID=A0ABW8APR2_9ACTN